MLKIEQAAFLGVVVLGFYLIHKAGNAAKAVGTAINPADSENLVNKGVSAVGKAVSGNEGWSLGGWIYDVTHPDYADLGASGKLKQENYRK